MADSFLHYCLRRLAEVRGPASEARRKKDNLEFWCQLSPDEQKTIEQTIRDHEEVIYDLKAIDEGTRVLVQEAERSSRRTHAGVMRD